MNRWHIAAFAWSDAALRGMPAAQRRQALKAAQEFRAFHARRAWLADLQCRLADALTMAETGLFDWPQRAIGTQASLAAAAYGVDPHVLAHDDGALYIVTDADIRRAAQLFHEALARVADWYDTHDAATGEPHEQDEQR